MLTYAAEFLSPLLGEREDISLHHKNVNSPDMLEREEGEFPRENGQRKSNGIDMETKYEEVAERQPDVVDDHPGKSRSLCLSLHLSSCLCFECCIKFCKFLYWWPGVEALVLEGY